MYFQGGYFAGDVILAKIAKPYPMTKCVATTPSPATVIGLRKLETT
jgi:hypothetical protein